MHEVQNFRSKKSFLLTLEWRQLALQKIFIEKIIEAAISMRKRIINYNITFGHTLLSYFLLMTSYFFKN